VSDKLSVLSPLDPPGNLAEQVIARLANDIRSGRLAPGARLPTEQALSSALGVSRTVVREAVAPCGPTGWSSPAAARAPMSPIEAGPFPSTPPRPAALTGRV
jgi:DNA-binding transcriptional MocR family regulator